jgi:hypothetical protein
VATNETSKAGPEAEQGKAAKTEETPATGAAKGTDGIALLKQQHRDVETALGQKQGDAGARLRALCRAWVPHAMIEEELVFSEVDPSGDEGAPFRAGEIQRDLVNVLVADAIRVRRRPEAVEARLTVLEPVLRAAMAAEEKAGDGLYVLAGKAGVELAALGPRIAARADELKRDAEADALDPPEPRSLRLRQSGGQQALQERETMARRDMPERDDRGRFMSDDDDRDYGRGRYSRGRDDEGRFTSGGNGGRMRDDEGRFTSGGSGGRMRDEEGRFTSGRGRDRDDDRGYRSYGARRDDDDRRYSRGRDDDRYGDRYGSDRGQGGWFGDSEGHSRASREGWEHRGRDYDDDRRYGRSRDDDDDRRGRDRGQGGWFGDSEGHSQASRRGWEGRR